jgi:PIN domain nuclease of toxin-antitoxin system
LAIRYSLDTHVVYWNLAQLPRLSPAAKQVFAEAGRGQAELLISHIVIAELYYLLRKLNCDSLFPIFMAKAATTTAFIPAPIELDDLRGLPNHPEIPEMHDRLLAIQAKRLGAILVTCDQSIRASSQIQTLW